MTKSLGIIALVLTLSFAIFNAPNTKEVEAQGSGTINQLEQWRSTTSPYSAITQNVWGKTLLLTGLNDGCLELINGRATTTTGLPCGSGTGGGGGGGFPTYFQNGGATLNVATTTVNFTPNSFAVVESPDDTLTIRVSTSTLGLLASAISDFVSTVRTSISETIDGLTYTSGTGVFSLDSGYVIPTTTRAALWDNASGTVTSVAMSVPTGFSIAGTPITTSGTLALTYGSGYEGFLTASGTAWTNFYNTPSTRITAGTGIDWTANTLNTVLTAGDGLTLTVEDFDCDTASASVFGCLTAADWGLFDDKVSTTSSDTEAELEAWLTDVTNVFTNNDGALADDNLTNNSIEDLNDVAAMTENTGDLLYWNGSTWTDTATNTLGLGTVTSVAMSVPTGLSITGTPITSNGTLAVTQTAGYIIPTTTRLSTLDAFAATPSTVITAGTGIDWTGNTLNGVYTAGDALTLTGEDFDFDGGATPAGELGGTWASPTIDDSLAVTSWNLTTPTLTSFFGTPCTGNDFLQDISDTGAFTCVTATGGGGGGSGGGWATTTGTNDEVGEGVTYTATDVFIGGSQATTSAFTFDPESSRLNIASTTAVATGTITSQAGALIFGSSTAEKIELNFNRDNTLTLLSSTGISTFLLEGVGLNSTASSSLASLRISALRDSTWSLGTNGMVLQTNGSTAQWVATNTLGISGGVGGSGELSDWQLGGTGYLVPTTTVGISVSASSTISELTTVTATSTNHAITGTLDLKRSSAGNLVTFNNSEYFSGIPLALYTFSSGGMSLYDRDNTERIYIDPHGTSSSQNANGIGVQGIFNSSDFNTAIDFDTNAMQFFADGVNVIDVDSTGVTMPNTTTTGTASSSVLVASNSIDLFGGGAKTSANLLCIQLTGSADLCDGSDGGGAGGGVSDWLKNTALDAITPTTTVGIVVNASSTISELNTASLRVNSDTVTDLTGFGMTNNSGALGLLQTGAADGECLVYESTGPTIDWASCGGAGGSKWTDGTNFTYLTNTSYDLAFGSNATETAPFWWDVSATTSYIGNGGTGDSVLTFGPTGSEWTMGFDDTDDSFSISSTTALGSSPFFHFSATSSILYSTSALVLAEQESGNRIGINTSSYYGNALLDHVVINGRRRNAGWYIVDCPITNSVTIAADGTTSCDSISFFEDGTETLVAVAGNGYTYSQLGGALANGGAGVFVNGASAGWIRLATSTPSMEITARIGTIAANSSTTQYFIGYTNHASAATTYETPPTAGCFFTASTTQANWRAICRTALASATNVDTGIASTSLPTGAGKWNTFRIDADATHATFWIKNGDGIMNKVADISTTYPSTVALNSGIHWGRTTGTQAIQFDFFGLNVQWRKFTPNQ